MSVLCRGQTPVLLPEPYGHPHTEGLNLFLTLGFQTLHRESQSNFIAQRSLV